MSNQRRRIIRNILIIGIIRKVRILLIAGGTFA
jgi:hypothetical protein